MGVERGESLYETDVAKLGESGGHDGVLRVWGSFIIPYPGQVGPHWTWPAGQWPKPETYTSDFGKWATRLVSAEHHDPAEQGKGGY